MGAQTKILIQLGLNNTKNIDEIYINNKVKNICKKANNINGEDRIELLLKVVTFIDLTLLNTDNTMETIDNLCLKAIRPIHVGSYPCDVSLHAAAVCVHPAIVDDVINMLLRNPVQKIFVASVAGDFPSGKLPFELRLAEIKNVVAIHGVDEIDLVIDRSLVWTHDWDELFNQLLKMREICGNKRMKVILSVGDLPSLNHVYKASMVAMAAGADFIKTSTGKEVVNATLPVGIIMCQAIREYHTHTGRRVGLKPAGGIKTATQALEWFILIEEFLGHQWLDKELFRIGASSLLDDIIKEFK